MLMIILRPNLLKNLSKYTSKTRLKNTGIESIAKPNIIKKFFIICDI